VGSPAPGNVVNLMDALRQSIAAEKPARAGEVGRAKELAKEPGRSTDGEA